MNRTKSFLVAAGFALALALMCSACSEGSEPKKALVGQWDTMESSVARDLISDNVEFLNDGTGMMEASNLKGVGAYAEVFTWKIDNDGRLILMSPTGAASIYSIVEISKSALILEGNVAGIGHIRTTYSKRQTITDSRDNKKYRVVKIGEQTWMAENLNIEIGNSACYDNKPENCQKYGRLYDWETALKACPKGWHLPSDEEWMALVNFAGGDKVAGKKLKARSGWNKAGYRDGNGEGLFGFSALPGGVGNGTNFNHVGNAGYWWSSSEYGNDLAYYRYMSIENDSWDYGNKPVLFSIRCLQD